MANEWSIVVPETTTAGRQNRVLDPSAESGLASGGATFTTVGTTPTITQDTTYSRFGFHSYKIVPSSTNQGIALTTATLANTIHYVSFYLLNATTLAGTIQVSLDGTNWNTVATLNGIITTGLRVGVSILAAQANASTALWIRNTAQETWYVDGIDCKAVTYATIYTDGAQPGCTWDGLANDSTSTANAQIRSQGRENVIETTYGVAVSTDGATGQGVAPIENITQEYALQSGGEFQDIKIHPRVLTLKCHIPSTSLANLHSLRKAFWNVIKPDLVAPTQPFTLVYNAAQAGSAKKLYGSFYYESGMEVTGSELALLDSFDLRLVATDPFWYEDAQEQTALAQQATLGADYAFARIGGQWKQLGSGFNGNVYCIAIDYHHNRIYFGGSYVTANGVTCNGIAYWDGTTFQPLGNATKGTGVAGTGIVFSIAIAPNGDIWAGGNFTTANGNATKGLAKWAYKAVQDVDAVVFATSTTFANIFAIAIDKNYRVYIGGTFTAFNGTANCSYFTYTSDQGTTWVAPTATVASGGTPAVRTLAVDTNGLAIYLGGDFTAIAGVANTLRLAKFDGASTFTAISTGSATAPNATIVLPDGTTYFGGQNGYFAKWNGNTLTSISGLTSHVYAIAYDAQNNLLHIPGHVYNFSIFFTPDITIATIGAPSGEAVHKLTGDIYVATGSGSQTTTESGITTITPVSTSTTYPLIIITATTTAASQTTLNFIENQSTGQRLYINALALNTGETLTIDLRPGKKTLTSNWRGDVTSYVLSNSDLANFKLLPGANTIALYLTGTLTGAAAIIQDVPQHVSVDGGAV